MRELIALVAVAGRFLNCNAAFAQIQVCDDTSNCKIFSSQQDADRYVEDLAREKEAQARDIVLPMPIDYRDCILPALLDEMLPLAKKGTEHLYVADMDKELRAKLAEHGVTALPESAFPKKIKDLQDHTLHTSYWHFSFLCSALRSPDDRARHKSPARCQTPASAQRQSCRTGAPVPRGKRTVRRRLRLPVRGVAHSRTVFPSVVPWTQQPRQAARRADGTPRVERVDQNRQAPTALLRRPAYLGSNHESPSAHTTQTSWGGWHD